MLIEKDNSPALPEKTPISKNERLRYALARYAGGTANGERLAPANGGRYLEAILAFRPEMDEDRIFKILQLTQGWLFDQGFEMPGFAVPAEQFRAFLIEAHLESGNNSAAFVKWLESLAPVETVAIGLCVSLHRFLLLDQDSEMSLTDEDIFVR